MQRLKEDWLEKTQRKKVCINSRLLLGHLHGSLKKRILQEKKDQQYSSTRKQAFDIDILITSRNSDKKSWNE